MTSPASDAIPTQIGPYRILETLGEGGMGTVYLAEQREPVRRRVALKLIKLGMDSKAVLARFEAERRALSMMEHSCIATVLDAGVSAQGQPYFVMEFVKGIPITDYCDQNKLGLKERIELLQKVCSGVQHAHLKGVMHRDLKPGNVLVTLQDGKATPKIIDFGLAKAVDHHLVEATLFTEQGVMLGTPEYMSPEQAGLGGLDVDTRTDVYSLGVLLYELLVGELPFSRKALRDAGMLEMQRVIREQEPQKPSTRITTLGDAASALAAARRVDVGELQKKLRGDLDWIVLKALEKDRTRRYETAQELAADLQRHMDFEPVLASPPSAAYRVKKFVRRYRMQCAAAAVVFVTIVGGGLGTYWQYRRAEANATRIEGLLTAANAEAAKNRIFADVALLAEAKKVEEELYPAFPDKVPAMESWLRDFGEPLAARLPELERSLAELRTKAKPCTEEQRTAAQDSHPRMRELQRLRSELEREDDADRREEVRRQIPPVEAEVAVAGYEFADNTDDYVHRVLSQVVQELGPFVSTTIPGVRARLLAARTVQQKTIDAHRAKWDEAIAAIRASDDVRASKLYGGFPLTPQIGLVPLGMDQHSKLWEFAHLASGTPGKEVPQRDASGRLVPTGDIGIVFVLLPGGTLPEGTPAKDDGSKKRLTVKLTPFFLGKYEITQGQWQRLTGTNPSHSRMQNDLALPVEKVNWFDCESALRQQGLALPSELQWEYGIRAGTTTKWWTGDKVRGIDAAENIGRNANRLLPAGSGTPNGFGLFDMGGNVMEWCVDAYGNYGTEQAGDGRRPDPSEGLSSRCGRGSACVFGTFNALSGYRGDLAPADRGIYLGLRAARAFSQ